tara:strand:+ start:5411 stop:6946 length:1536 start_codon:yes stop_codon:yes gene_type:complete
MQDKVASIYLKRYEKARSHRLNFESLFDECYEYALPQREGFTQLAAGQRRDDRIFDETAVVGVQEFASRLQSGLVPNFARWADLVAGSEVPSDQTEAIDNQLEEVTEYVFQIMQNSNFGQEAHEAFLDLAVGTGCLLVEEGDALNPVRFNAIPLPQLVLENGADDRIDHVYRERKIRNSDILIAYPDAVVSEMLMDKILKEPDNKANMLEVVCRIYDKPNEEQNAYFVICKDTRELIHQDTFKGAGSNPFVCFRWSKAAGEVYGRGPLVNSLSAIKTTNLTIELVLENAQMAISGIYQMDDDGVINTDSINLVPGTIIPKSPNSAGLQPIRAAGSFDVANLILGDMRNNIKRALYNDMLGDPNKTPATATEVAERMADLSRRIGSAFGRLQAEFVQPVLQRVVYILKKQGRIDVPTLNGRDVKIRSVSPLAQAQANQDIAAVDRFLEMVGGRFGPQMVNLLVSSEEASAFLAKKFGVPDNLIRDSHERAALAQAMQQMAAQSQGMAPQQEQ